MKKLLLFILFCLFILPVSGRSSEYEPLSVYGEWAIFKTTQDGKVLCYAMNIGEKSKSNYANRGVPFFLLIKQKGIPAVEVNTSVGYIINDTAGSCEIEINNKIFPLINFMDMAWAYSLEDDESILEEFKKSAVFSIYAKSTTDKYSLDIYSLNGFKEAYQEIQNLCN